MSTVSDSVQESIDGVVVGENSASTELKIKAPEGFKPRFEEPYKVRGRK